MHIMYNHKDFLILCAFFTLRREVSWSSIRTEISRRYLNPSNNLQTARGLHVSREFGKRSIVVTRMQSKQLLVHKADVTRLAVMLDVFGYLQHR